MVRYGLLAYVGWVVALSLYAFAVYGWDKRQAKLQRRRIPEEQLHRVSLLGGWPGAIAGQQLFRHKTQKTSFKLINVMSIVTHVAIWAVTWRCINQ